MLTRRRRALAVSLFLLFAFGGTAMVARSVLRDDKLDRTATHRSGLDPRAASARGASAGAVALGREDDRSSASTSTSTSTETRATPASTAAATSPGAGAELTRDEILAGLARGEPGFEVLASRLPVEKKRLEPRWGPGDEWLVETWYRQMQTPEDEVWSGPATWRFRVERETSYRDRRCHEIVIARADEPSPPTIVFVTVDTHRLAALETTITQQGKTRTVTWVADDDLAAPGAVKAPLSIAPCDLPPLGVEATVSPPGLGWDALGLSKDVLATMPRDAELVGHGQPALDLEYLSPTDGTRVFQRWSSTDPRWPVVSRTETTLSFRRSR